MLITPEYREQQRIFHQQRSDYGVSGHKWADHILNLAEKLQTKSILDYGCGKETLQKAIPYPIQNYDPCIPGRDSIPAPADIVVCTDVLEHVELDCLEDVLFDLQRCTLKVIFFDIATQPAKKFLPDGRNAHLIQENSNWWLSRLLPYFLIQSMTILNTGSILLVAIPLQQEEKK